MKTDNKYYKNIELYLSQLFSEDVDSSNILIYIALNYNTSLFTDLCLRTFSLSGALWILIEYPFIKTMSI